MKTSAVVNSDPSSNLLWLWVVIGVAVFIIISTIAFVFYHKQQST